MVIGLSGGIDSALTATMAVDALGAECVHGVLLPGPYSSGHSVADAQELASNLALDVQTISIDKPYEAFQEALDVACKGRLTGLADENVQARCRMVCLMALSNTFGWMVLNTGNKSESYLGYATLYGDMVGAFAPLGDVYKTEVYELARWRNKQERVIPQNTIDKAPSAELSSDQEDETSLGLSYEVLDAILSAVVDQGYSCEELLAQGYRSADVDNVLSRITAFQFKRSYEPPHP